MPQPKAIQEKNAKILKSIASLGAMRKGSVCEQFQFLRRKDGSRLKRGPYLMYTCKKNGKTKGKRLSKKNADVYRVQINTFREFQKLCGQFVENNEQLADIEAADGKKGKKNSNA